MPQEIWVTKTTYEKNATNGIDVFTDRQKMADIVLANELSGGTVQVYECRPVDHHAYAARASIEITHPATGDEL